MSEMTARHPAQGVPSNRPVAGTGRPVMVTIALISLMLPVSFNIGSWLMSPSRALFLVMLPIWMISLFRGQYGKVNYIDVLVLLYMAWRTFVPFIHNPQVALQYAGSNSIIFLGGYMAARASIRSPEDFRWMAKVLGAFVIFSFPFAVYEATTGDFVIPHLFEQIPGITSVKDVNYQRRLGMDRVQFVFVHPIHYGLFCSMAVSAFFLGLKGVISGFWRWIGTGLILGCCLMSVSSGPFLAALAQIGLTMWGFMFRKKEKRWKIFGGLFAAFYAIIEIGSNRPGIVALISLLSFSSSTANVRFILFEYGMQQVYRTPLIGIGFRRLPLPPWMTGSLDNFWLAIAVIFGVPAFLFLFSAVVFGLIGIGRRKFKPGGALDNTRLAWAITLISITLTLSTVFIWTEVASLVMFMIGSGVFLLHAQETEDGAAPVPVDTGRQPMGYSRYAPEMSRNSPAEPLPPGRRAAKGKT